MHWLVHLLGLDDPSGHWYMWWSGPGSDLGELAILGALFSLYRRHTCHVNSPRFCWRPGTHPVPGTPFRTCARHHPAVPDRISGDHIAAASTDFCTDERGESS